MVEIAVLAGARRHDARALAQRDRPPRLRPADRTVTVSGPTAQTEIGWGGLGGGAPQPPEARKFE
jgi:hypothetical protein